MTTAVKSIANLITHSKCMNVVVEPVTGYPGHVATARSYGVLKPWRGKIDVCLRNHSVKQITLPKWTVVGEIKAANIILVLLAPKPTGHESGKGEATTWKRKYESQKRIVGQNWCNRVRRLESEWTKRCVGTHNRICKYICYGQHGLGKASLVKHSIRLTDNTPFKECYHWTLPSMYEEVQEHMKEMIEIGAIRQCHSLWDSPVVLICKTDSKLLFCIDLRMLNACTIKDSYSLPRIEDTLDSLNGAVWFTALDLKSGYWQAEMDEAAKPLVAFTVGLLGFYKCDHMPFGLVNAQLHSGGWWRHVWVTFSSAGVTSILRTLLYFRECQKIT